MKRKALCFILTLLVIAVFSLGCGGGGGGSNPASSTIAGQARVSGVVVDSSNNPIANANVRLVLASNALVNSLTGNTNPSLRLATTGNQTEFNTITKNNGEYTFTNVPYGEYTLSAVTENGGQIVTKLAVRASVVVQPDLTIMPFGVIEGQVANGNKGIEGAIVYVDGTSYCSATDNSGNFSIRYVPVRTLPYSLKVLASGYELSETISVVATTTTLVWKKNLPVAPISSANAYTLNCKITGDGASQNNLIVFAVNQNDGNTYASKVESSNSVLSITKLGTYNVFAAYLSNGFNLVGTIESVVVDTLGSSKNIELEIGKPLVPSSSASVTGKVLIRDTTSESDKTLFTLALYNDETGAELKKKINNGSDFIFNNLSEGSYSLVVYSDNYLRIKRGIELQSGQTLDVDEFWPCNLGLDNILTLNIDGTVNCNINNPVDGGSASDLPVSYSVYAIDSNKKPIVLHKSGDTSKTEFDVDPSSNNITLDTDNVSGSDKIGLIRFFFKDKAGTQRIFENSFYISSGKEILANKTISLKDKVTNANLTLSDDIILFKPIEADTNNDNKNEVFYLVVTKSKAYLFDSTAENSKLFDFGTLGASLKQGNACYIDKAQMVVVQFLAPPSNGETSENLVITGCKVSPTTTSGFETVNIYSGNGLTGTEAGNSITLTDIYSANRITGKCNDDNSVELFSVCDNSVRILKSTTSGYELKSNLYFGKNGYTLATDSTIVPTYSGYDIFSLSKDSYKGDVYLTKTSLTINSGNNYTVDEGHYISMWIGVGNDGVSAEYIKTRNTSCNCYHVYLKQSDYNISDCLDNIEAENKVFITDNYNWNNGNNPTNVDPKFVFSNTVYSGANIKSSYVNPYKNNNRFPFDAWIERDSQQFIKLRNLRNYKEEKISVNQIFNSSSYLEGSIGYTTADGNKIHIICADDSGNIQIMVLNCIDNENTSN